MAELCCLFAAAFGPIAPAIAFSEDSESLEAHGSTGQLATFAQKTAPTSFHSVPSALDEPKLLTMKPTKTIQKQSITLLRVIPTMTFQNSLLTQFLSEAFVTALWPNQLSQSGILSGTLSDVLSGILIWHSSLAFFSGILFGIPSGIPSGILIWHSSLAFFSGILSGTLSDVLSGILSGISFGILSGG